MVAAIGKTNWRLAVLAAVFTFGIMFGVTAGALTARASDTISCFDIAKEGMYVPFPGPLGVNNSGKPIFDDVPLGSGNPAYQWQACLEDDTGYPDWNNPDFGSPGTPYYQVRGWAWNDNLGWISMFCSGGFGGTNLGRPCGSIRYGVTIDDAGYLHGYAWGDNIGWISFDNGAFSNVRIDIDHPECQGYVYGPTSPDPACPPHTKADTTAWSDNVGWMDFDGVIFPWYQVVEMLTDAEVTVELIPDPDSTDKFDPLNYPPLADGSESYEIKVTIVDKDGDPVGPPRYDTTIDLDWVRDTVKKDQTVTGPSIIASPVCGLVIGRATAKPCSLTSLYTGNGVWQGFVTSIAPTSNMNVLYEDGVPFSYETFVSPEGFLATSLESNDLVINSADISVFDTAVGLCAYGDDVLLCNPKERGFNGMPVVNKLLKFLPQTEITTLTDPDGNNYIDISVGNPEYFPIEGRKAPGATVELTAGMIEETGLGFVFDDGDGNLEWGVDTDITKDIVSSLGVGLTDFIAGIVQNPEEEVSQFAKGLYIYSEVTEPHMLQDVKYYSNKLPRVTGATAVQPVVVLRGSIYSVGAVTTTTREDVVVNSLGDISTNIVRDNVYQNVVDATKGSVDEPLEGELTVTWSDTAGFIKTGGSGTVVSLKPDSTSNEIPQVYYAVGDVHIGNVGDTISWTGTRTIMVNGGNVYIDANLYNAAPGTPRPKLGIIALKDYISSDATARNKQGHVYIHDSVSNIQANIFADGSVFTYEDPSQSILGDGRPDYGTLQAYEDSAKRYQLYGQGSIASQNTIGGATRAEMINGLGQPTDDLLEARQYDLNYLRMYVGMIRRDPSTGDALDKDGNKVSDQDLNIIDTATGLPWSVYDGGDLYPPDEIEPGVYIPAEGLDPDRDLGSTYIFFDPPTESLYGFKILPGFAIEQVVQ